MTHSLPLTFARVVLAAAALLVLGVVFACNGILGNAIVDADAGSAEAGPTDRRPGQKYCSAIDSCGPKDDTAFGCGAASCDPCNLPNAKAKCGGTGCVVDTCFPGFEPCGANQVCTDVTVATNCGKCGNACTSGKPFCAPAGNTFACVANCQPPLVACGSNGQCFDLTNSVPHCGLCGHDCFTQLVASL